MLNLMLYPFQANVPLGHHTFSGVIRSPFPYINTLWCSAATYTWLKPPKNYILPLSAAILIRPEVGNPF